MTPEQLRQRRRAREKPSKSQHAAYEQYRQDLKPFTEAMLKGPQPYNSPYKNEIYERYNLVSTDKLRKLNGISSAHVASSLTKWQRIKQFFTRG